MATKIKDFSSELQGNAHSEFQVWRRKNPYGYVLQLRNKRQAILHRSDCKHFGDTSWQASPGGDLGKRAKKCSSLQEPLVEWAKQSQLHMSHCSDCFPSWRTEAHGWPVKFVGDDDELIWMKVKPQSMPKPLSSKAYVKALTQLKLTSHQRNMLRIHYGSPGHTTTARQLALSMGYTNWKPINAHYGHLGRLIGENLGLPADEKLAVICTFGKFPGLECQLTLRGEVVAALEQLGIVSDDMAPIQEEIPITETLAEGSAYQVQVSAYERNPIARAKAIEHHGRNCKVCGFRFGDVYGPHAEKYIQVHHLLPLSSIKEEYQVDPIKDLLPVCANCHAVIHLKSPPYSPTEVREMLAKAKRIKAP